MRYEVVEEGRKKEGKERTISEMEEEGENSEQWQAWCVRPKLRRGESEWCYEIERKRKLLRYWDS